MVNSSGRLIMNSKVLFAALNSSVRKVPTAILTTLLIAAASFPADAAEKRKFKMTGTWKETLSQNAINPADDPNHAMIQASERHAESSMHPDFNGIELLNFIQLDNYAGRGTHRGYAIQVFQSGDRTYRKYEGTQEITVNPDGTFEGVGRGVSQFLGGMGKFAGIRGGASYIFKFGNAGGQYSATVEYMVEVEY
jgi:hypothetical protein